MLTIFILTIITSFILSHYLRKKPIPEGKIEVRTVKYGLPLIGHGLSFSRDIIGYIRKCQKEYGNIFKLKIFKKTIIVVCDRNLTEQFFKAREPEMSLYHVLESLYFADGFSDDPSSLQTIIHIVKSTIAVNFDIFMPKIVMEAEKMVEEMKKTNNVNKINIINTMIKFVARTSARCFLCLELSDDFLKILIDFTHFLNKIVISTYFVPLWILRLIINPFLGNYRRKMQVFMEPEIEKYRTDITKSDSLILRRAVDYVTEKGEKLTNRQICEVIVCLLYVSSENTALGLSNTIVDLVTNKTFLEKLKKESQKYLIKNDMRGLIGDSVIDACVMESCRLNTHIFALNRKPLDMKSIGDYYVGDVDVVAICEPMLMKYECAEDLFQDSEKYNPDRYLGVNGQKIESKTAGAIMTFGKGVHLCPGSKFALMEIKVAASLILNNFNFTIEKNDMGQMNYFSPSAFAERQVNAKISVIEPITERTDDFKEYIFNGQKYHIKILKNNAWLFRQALTQNEQIEYYQYTTSLSKNSKEQQEIYHAKIENPYPICYYNLIYTGTNNCETPQKWFDLSEKIYSILRTHFDFKEDLHFNSLYAQLYGPKSVMNLHKDEYVNYGISVNIGASADFIFGDEIFQLHSGDILVADFSKTLHGIQRIQENSEPGWLTDEFKNDTINNFGRTRLSVQIRDVSKCKIPELITIEQFKSLINN